VSIVANLSKDNVLAAILGRAGIPFAAVAGMDAFQRQHIASRIRGLLSGQDEGSLAVIARRLRVDVTSLLMSIDEAAPHPTLDVIAAVVREYGVDPCWLLTGYYDCLTHRKALSATTDEIPVLVGRMVGLPQTPLS
jgi:hypothetical protein